MIALQSNEGVTDRVAPGARQPVCGPLQDGAGAWVTSGGVACGGSGEQGAVRSVPSEATAPYCSLLPAPCSLLEIDLPQALGSRERQPQPRSRRVHGHVPHHRAGRGDLDRLRALRGRIERYDPVRPRLVVPDAPVGTRAGEVAHLSGGGIEPAQLAPRVV